MKQGKVKWFDSVKGYGFIEEKGTGQEYFVHVSGLKESISEGDNVEFTLVDGKKGKNATGVKIVG